MSYGKSPLRPHMGIDKAAIQAALDKLSRHMKDFRGFDESVITDRWDARIEALQKKIHASIGDAVGSGTPEHKKFALPRINAALEAHYGDRLSSDEVREGVRKGIEQSIADMTAVRKLLMDRMDGDAAVSAPSPTPAPTAAPALTPAPTPRPTSSPTPAPTPMSSSAPITVRTSAPIANSSQSPSTGRVAVIGELDETASALSGLLEQLGLEPVMIGQQPGREAAISVDALDELRSVDFAVFTPTKGSDSPSTLVATGFLLAVLSKERICYIGSGGGKPLLQGAPRIAIDDGGLWHLLLARTMKRAGVEVDLNKAA